MLQKIRNMKGFTIIELMIVIAIIAILAALVIPTMNRIMTSKKYEPKAIIEEKVTEEKATVPKTNDEGMKKL